MTAYILSTSIVVSPFTLKLVVTGIATHVLILCWRPSNVAVIYLLVEVLPKEIHPEKSNCFLVFYMQYYIILVYKINLCCNHRTKFAFAHNVSKISLNAQSSV